MKKILQLCSLGLFVATLSSCAVNGGGYVGARPGYARPGYAHPGYARPGYVRPAPHPHYSNSYHPSYNRPRPSAVNARVNARTPLVRANTGLSLF